MLGSCVTSYDKCCIIFRPWTVTYVFWIMDKNKKKRQMKLLKSLSESPPKLCSIVCGAAKFQVSSFFVWKTLNREIGRKSWCHNGARDSKVVEVQKKMGLQNFTFLIAFLPRLPLKFPFAPDRFKARTRRKEKPNFRTFIASFTTLRVNFHNVIARAANGQSSLLLVRSRALWQVSSMSLTV